MNSQSFDITMPRTTPNDIPAEQATLNGKLSLWYKLLAVIDKRLQPAALGASEGELQDHEVLDSEPETHTYHAIYSATYSPMGFYWF